jgi:hypothetical protein
MDKRWDPFLRKDIDKLHILWSMPWYCTFWPRFFVGWVNAMICGIFILVITAGVKDKTQLSGWRQKAIRCAIAYACYIGVLVTGHYKVVNRKVELDYR